ncbi:MAG: hypothetical protein IJ555_09860, partial [Ruminococcus sp.]|nr:hypothetical protein [Ruminococcus sp.]
MAEEYLGKYRPSKCNGCQYAKKRVNIMTNDKDGWYCTYDTIGAKAGNIMSSKSCVRFEKGGSKTSSSSSSGGCLWPIIKWGVIITIIISILH